MLETTKKLTKEVIKNVFNNQNWIPTSKKSKRDRDERLQITRALCIPWDRGVMFLDAKPWENRIREILTCLPELRRYTQSTTWKSNKEETLAT